MPPDESPKSWTFKDVARVVSQWAQANESASLTMDLERVVDAWHLIVEPMDWDSVPQLTRIDDLLPGMLCIVYFNVQCTKPSDHYAGARYSLQIKCQIGTWIVSEVKQARLVDLHERPEKLPHVSNTDAEKALHRRVQQVTSLYVALLTAYKRPPNNIHPPDV